MGRVRPPPHRRSARPHRRAGVPRGSVTYGPARPRLRPPAHAEQTGVEQTRAQTGRRSRVSPPRTAHHRVAPGIPSQRTGRTIPGN